MRLLALFQGNTADELMNDPWLSRIAVGGLRKAWCEWYRTDADAVRVFYHQAPIVMVNWKSREFVSDLCRFEHGRGITFEMSAGRIADAGPVFKVKEVFHPTSSRPNRPHVWSEMLTAGHLPGSIRRVICARGRRAAG